MFLILFRNILGPQQMSPSLRAQGNVMSYNVSATMCPRLPVPLDIFAENDFFGEDDDDFIFLAATTSIFVRRNFESNP